MEGIDPKHICHQLNIDPSVKPKIQKHRKLSPEWYETLGREIDKLIANHFIKEALYPKWMANPALVRKHNGTWRICIDFIDLKKTCPKDSFPLPHIDQMVDSTI